MDDLNEVKSNVAKLKKESDETVKKKIRFRSIS